MTIAFLKLFESLHYSSTSRREETSIPKIVDPKVNYKRSSKYNIHLLILLQKVIEGR